MARINHAGPKVAPSSSTPKPLTRGKLAEFALRGERFQIAKLPAAVAALKAVDITPKGIVGATQWARQHNGTVYVEVRPVRPGADSTFFLVKERAPAKPKAPNTKPGGWKPAASPSSSGIKYLTNLSAAQKEVQQMLTMMVTNRFSELIKLGSKIPKALINSDTEMVDVRPPALMGGSRYATVVDSKIYVEMKPMYPNAQSTWYSMKL